MQSQYSLKRTKKMMQIDSTTAAGLFHGWRAVVNGWRIGRVADNGWWVAGREWRVAGNGWQVAGNG